MRVERRRAATTALAAPVVPLVFLANLPQTLSPVARLLRGDYGGAVAFGCGIAVGGSVVLALMSGRKFKKFGGSRLNAVLLAAAAPVLAVLVIVLGRFPWP